ERRRPAADVDDSKRASTRDLGRQTADRAQREGVAAEPAVEAVDVRQRGRELLCRDRPVEHLPRTVSPFHGITTAAALLRRRSLAPDRSSRPNRREPETR